MIQIRQKKQALRNSRRKEYLQKYFKQKRQLFDNNLEKFEQFNSNGFNQTQLSQNYGQQISSIQKLGLKSLEQNGLFQQIQNGNLLEDLQQCVQKVCRYRNLADQRFLLILISNILKDELKLYQKEKLLKISFQILQSLELYIYNLNCQKNSVKIIQKLKIIEPQVLFYYFGQVMQQCKILDEEDAIWVEKKLYPSFFNVLFIMLKNNMIQEPNSEYFVYDLYKFAQNCFDSALQFYQTQNLDKIKRNEDFFALFLAQYSKLSNTKQIYQKHNKVAQPIMLLINRIIQNIDIDIDRPSSIFSNDDVIYLMLQKASNQNKRVRNFALKALALLIKKEIQIERVQTIFFYRQCQQQYSTFEKVLRILSSNFQEVTQQQFNIIEFFSAIIQLFTKKQKFVKIMIQYWQKILNFALDILKNIQFQSFKSIQGLNRQQITIIKKSLEIICLLIEQGQKLKIKEKTSNFYLEYFLSINGSEIIRTLDSFLGQIEQTQQEDNEYIKELIDWLLTSHLFQENLAI